MTQAPIDTMSGEFKRAARVSQSSDVPQLKAKRLRHAELGILDLTYAPLRPRGVADDIPVVVYGARPDDATRRRFLASKGQSEGI